MARKFGTGTTNRVGTGKIDDQETTTEKWADSVAAQVATAASIKSILTKTIPVDYVYCDPENPRKLSITHTQITKIANLYPLEKNHLLVDDSANWIEDYITKVGEAETLTGKALSDFDSLVNFAASLKTADRMLHPIVVWQNESTFHLIAGERRLLTHILLGESNIAARIVEKDFSSAEKATLQWGENVDRVDESLSERVNHIKKILEMGEGIQKTTVTKLSKILGRSRAESQRYLAVLRYPNKILIEAINEGKIKDLQAAAALAQLPLGEVEERLYRKTTRTSVTQPAIKFNNKLQAPQFGQLIKAAAKQLQMEPIIKEVNLQSPKGINEAISLLLTELEGRNRG